MRTSFKRLLYLLAALEILLSLLYTFYLHNPPSYISSKTTTLSNPQPQPITTQISSPQLPTSQSQSQSQSPPRKNTTLLSPPLSTQGRNIITSSTGNAVKLSSINWYGASDIQHIPSGLSILHRSKIAETIKTLGFNSVRLPYSDTMVLQNPIIPPEHLTANPDLVGLTALQVFDAVVEALTDVGLAVIVNNHITSATWCCGINPCDILWYNSYLPFSQTLCQVRQTEESWIENWITIMRPLALNPLVIGVDLRNEPRSLWGTLKLSTYLTAAQTAANTLHGLNPHWLIIHEGLSSSNDLTYVRHQPLELTVPNKVVYSVHVYGWSGWGSWEGSYSGRTYDSFRESMRENWAYLLEEEIAPVWVGEFGAPREVGDWPSEGDLNYWDHLIKFLVEVDADFAYWAINPRKPKDNEIEAYSLIEDDWETPIMDYRTRDLMKLMRN